jgi:hypothetical protein
MPSKQSWRCRNGCGSLPVEDGTWVDCHLDPCQAHHSGCSDAAPPPPPPSEHYSTPQDQQVMDCDRDFVFATAFGHWDREKLRWGGKRTMGTLRTCTAGVELVLRLGAALAQRRSVPMYAQ